MRRTKIDSHPSEAATRQRPQRAVVPPTPSGSQPFGAGGEEHGRAGCRVMIGTASRASWPRCTRRSKARRRCGQRWLGRFCGQRRGQLVPVAVVATTKTTASPVMFSGEVARICSEYEDIARRWAPTRLRTRSTSRSMVAWSRKRPSASTKGGRRGNPLAPYSWHTTPTSRSWARPLGVIAVLGSSHRRMAPLNVSSSILNAGGELEDEEYSSSFGSPRVLLLRQARPSLVPMSRPLIVNAVGERAPRGSFAPHQGSWP